tara:strand:- start:2599 stop:3702 length:1104 start_codon:yes stop_codon:yes gene_type:complete
MAYSEVEDLILELPRRVRMLALQTLTKNYLFYRMRQANSMLQCHTKVEIPFYISAPNLGKWITYGDKLPDTSSRSLARGEVTNRYLVVPIGVDQLRQMENEGNPERIVQDLELAGLEAAWAMRRNLASATWNGTGGREPDGLTTIIEAAAPGSQTATVMGVDKSSKAWFRNKYVQLTNNFGHIAAGTSLPAGFIALLSLIRQTTVTTQRPSDLITTQDVFETIKRGMLEISSPMHMITDNNSAQFGFEAFKFAGSYVAWDPQCPTDRVYSLHLSDSFDPGRATNDPRDGAKFDTDLEDIGAKGIFDLNASLGIVGHPKIQFRKIAARRPYRELAETSWIITSHNLYVTRLSDQGVASSDNGSRWSTW